MKHASTRMIFSYWDHLRGERAAPDRGEIEPGEIRHVLPDTFILELTAARAAEIRLAGTRLCAFFGRELKGFPFHRLWKDDSIRDVINLVDIVVDETAGVVAGLTGFTDENDSVDFEMVLLPLKHRGRTHSRLLGAMSPATVPSWIGLYPIVSVETKSIRVIWPSGQMPEPEQESESLDPVAERRRRFVVHDGGRV